MHGPAKTSRDNTPRKVHQPAVAADDLLGLVAAHIKEGGGCIDDRHVRVPRAAQDEADLWWTRGIQLSAAFADHAGQGTGMYLVSKQGRICVL